MINNYLSLAELAKIEILNCERNIDGISYWIGNKNFFVDSSSTKQRYVLSIYAYTDFFDAVAADCNRFAMAACESFSVINNVHIKNNGMAWTIIRLYYAAFFAAHATMRLFGYSCTKVSHEHAQIINDMMRLTCSPEIDLFCKGNYRLRFFENNQNITFTSGGHSHELAWRVYMTMIEELRLNIAKLNTTSSTKLAIDNALECVLLASGKAGSNNNTWLSNFRNSVNYKQSDKTWLPHKFKNAHKMNIPTPNSVWNSETYNYNLYSSSDIESFFERTGIILRFFYEVFVAAKEKNNKCGKLFRNGLFKMFSIVC